MGNNKACVGAPIGTFADFRSQVSQQKLSGAWRAGWQMDYPLIQNFLQPVYYSNASSNDGKWSNEQFDDLVNKANAESDKAKAVSTFQDAEKVMVQQMPVIPLWYQNGSLRLLGERHQRLPEPVQRPGVRADRGQVTR